MADRDVDVDVDVGDYITMTYPPWLNLPLPWLNLHDLTSVTYPLVLKPPVTKPLRDLIQ